MLMSMRRWSTVARVVSMVCVPLAAGAAEKPGDWPRFRGPTGLGVSTEKGFPLRWGPSENIVWKTELPGAGSSSPIVVGERIFVTFYSGFGVPGEDRGSPEMLQRRVVCLARRDGKIRWATKVASKLPDQEKIREEHGWASSTPVADSQRVYAFFGKSGVFALDHEGKEQWKADVGSKLSGWGSAASPILAGDLVIVNASVESESLVALDAKTGREAWRAGGIKESWNTPILVPSAGGRSEIVLAVSGKVLGFDAASGKQVWSCDTDIGWYMVPCVVAGEGLVCAIGGRSGTAALALRTGGKGDVTVSHRLWTGEKGSNVSSPILHEGHLYWMSDTRETAFCAVAKSGEIVYEEKVPRAGQIYAAPVLVEGRIYYVARDGRTHVLAAKPEYALLAVNEIGERGTFNAGLVPAGGRLYLRSNRFLYAIGTR
jgi:hypothetical protein